MASISTHSTLSLVALTVTLLGVSSSVCAQPVVRVQAETRIELLFEPIPRQVLGTLRDDLGSSLPDRIITTAVRPGGNAASWEQHRVRTSASGQFQIMLGESADIWDVRATFAGNRQYVGVRAERRVDVAIADVSLHIELFTARLDLDAPSHTVTIRGSSAAGVDDLDISLEDELGRELTTGRMGGDGVISLQVQSADLGEAGPGRLRATSMADARRSSSRTEVSVIRFRHPRLTIEAAGQRYYTREAFSVTGRLSDNEGGLGDRAIALLLDGELHCTVLTQPDGTFSQTLTLEQAGNPHLIARFESDSPGRPTVTSDRLTLEIVAERGLGTRLFFVAMLLCLLVAIVLRRRSGMTIKPTTNQAPAIPTVRKSVVTTRTASLLAVAGVVRDCNTDAPIAGATVSITQGDDIVTSTTSDQQGAFEFGDQQRGAFVLRVGRSGYRSLQIELTIPHRGEWSRAEMRVESLRQIALAPLRRLARRLLARERTWGIWTNREIANERIGAILGEANADSLVHRVDDAYYGQSEPNEADIDKIEELAASATPASDKVD